MQAVALLSQFCHSAPMMQLQEIIIHTDGGCRGNPGPGGWAYVMRYGERYKEAWGSESLTTNNKMELTAVIMALSFLKNRIESITSSYQRNQNALPAWIDTPIRVYTDSLYVKNGISLWITEWKKRGWKTAARKPVLNQDLWLQLDELTLALKPQFAWVEGHSGDLDNERCDELVRLAAQSQ